MKNISTIPRRIVLLIDEKRSFTSSHMMSFEKGVINYFIIGLVLFSLITSLTGFSKQQTGDYPIYKEERIGAICMDGWRSYSTGRGTCSHHGGVNEWLYRKVKIGMYYSNHGIYYTISIVSFGVFLLPAFFFRYYRYTLILYSINTLIVLTSLMAFLFIVYFFQQIFNKIGKIVN